MMEFPGNAFQDRASAIPGRARGRSLPQGVSKCRMGMPKERDVRT